MRNPPQAPYQRANVANHGVSFSIRADVIARVHGRMRDGQTDNATLLVLKLHFSPRSYTSHPEVTLLTPKLHFSPQRAGQRARMATITLKFLAENGTSGLDAPTVKDCFPKGKFLSNQSSGTTKDPLTTTVNTVPTELRDGVVVIGHLMLVDTATGDDNAARWVIQENESKAGIPESLIVAVLLRRTDQNPFSMVPRIDVKISGSAFAQALANRRSEDDRIIFDPTLASSVQNLPFHLTDIDQEHLEVFWHSRVLKLEAVNFRLPIAVPDSDWPSDDRVPADAGGLDTPVEGKKFMPLSDPAFKESSKRAMYVELWNSSATKPGFIKGPQWKNLGDSVNNDTLSNHFSWFKDELKLPDFQGNGEQHNAQTSMTEAAGPSKGRSVEVLKTTDTFCSLLVNKAESQVSFQSFEDLKELLSQQELGTIIEFFEFPTEDYICFRKVDFGSCDFRSGGPGDDFSTSFFIQTPYSSGGFWSMFLVGKADPKAPDRARKLSCLIQTGADVNLEAILHDAASKASDSNYRHPLLLPYLLYKEYIRESSKKFKSVLEKVESVETRLSKVLYIPKQVAPQSQSKINEDDNRKVENWAELSNLLHNAYIEAVEMTRRRRFEKELVEALQKELSRGRPAPEMNYDIEWYTRRTNSDQLEITEIPRRIDSLNNLIYSMMSQQDNAVSTDLAREGLYDSKAMKSLSLVTFLFLPGTFVATIFTTNVVSFQDPGTERTAYIVVPLTAVLMILYGLFQLQRFPWSKSKDRARDLEAGKSSQKPDRAVKMD